jgi:hypothetical protein
MALDIAFARRDFVAVRRIRALLGDVSLPSRVAAKYAIARLPPRLADVLASPMLWAGSLLARKSGHEG